MLVGIEVSDGSTDGSVTLGSGDATKQSVTSTQTPPAVSIVESDFGSRFGPVQVGCGGCDLLGDGTHVVFVGLGEVGVAVGSAVLGGATVVLGEGWLLLGNDWDVVGSTGVVTVSEGVVSRFDELTGTTDSSAPAVSLDAEGLGLIAATCTAGVPEGSLCSGSDAGGFATPGTAGAVLAAVG